MDTDEEDAAPAERGVADDEVLVGEETRNNDHRTTITIKKKEVKEDLESKNLDIIRKDKPILGDVHGFKLTETQRT